MKLSYSLPVITKSRCKYCQSTPVGYYFVAGKLFLNTLRSSKHEKLDYFINYNYNKLMPKQCTKVSNFSYQIPFAKVGTAALRFNRYLSAFRKMQIMVSVDCKCKKTTWAISAEPRFGIAEKGFDFELKHER